MGLELGARGDRDPLALALADVDALAVILRPGILADVLPSRVIDIAGFCFEGLPLSLRANSFRIASKPYLYSVESCAIMR
jgi:hypothetical protein